MNARVPPSWPLLVAAGFCLYSLLLLWNAMQSQQQLRVAADTRLVADSKRRASALAQFALQRRALAEELARLHEVQTYLANKSLGMSPRYGLNSSLEAVVRRLETRVQQRGTATGRTLTRAAYVDAEGQWLADTDAGGGALPLPAGREPTLTLDPGRRVVVATAPVLSNGGEVFSGTLVTVSDIGELYQSLISLDALGSYREVVLTADGQEITAVAGAAPVLPPEQALQLAQLPPNQPTERHGNTGVATAAGGDDEGIAVMTPVPGLPALLVTTLSRSEIYGQLSSPWYLGSLSAFPLLLLLAALRMTRLQQRAQALQLDAAHKEAIFLELEEKKAELEEQVRRRTEELNRLFHALPDHYFRTRRDGTILEYRVGRDAAPLVGAADCTGRRLRDELPGDAVRPLDSALAEVAQGIDQSVVEFGVQQPGGHRHFEARLLPLEDAQCVIVVRDVTERHENDAVREANRIEAERLVRVKSEFLANMSHEIRTPLNAVLGLAQLGVDEHDLDAARLGFQRIEDAGRHLLGIIDDILDLSKLEAGKLGVEQRPYRLASVVDAALALVVGRTAAKGLQLRMTLAESLPEWVLGDALRVKQVLVNLLSNAVKFTAQGEVVLEVGAVDGRLSLAVTDTGIGMDAKQLGRLFQPFEQADSSITRRFGGTGLGLAISANLAALMGGEIAVASQPGRGSTFTLRLPLVAAQPRVAGGLGLPAATRRLAGLRVLAAEDVEVNRIVLEGQLLREGAEVVFAEDGRQAVDAVVASLRPGARGFDAVLMDVQMPLMDGLEATRRIRQLAPRLPVIGLTAHAMHDEREHCLDAGMVERVVKPADLNVLVAALLRHGGRRAGASDAAGDAADTRAAELV